MIYGEHRVFRELVRYHISNNLEECLPHIKQGRCNSPKGKPYQEMNEEKRSPDENKLYAGILIVANGDTLIRRLKEGGVINDELLEEFVSVPDAESFQNYLRNQEGEDGAHVYDSINKKIVPVWEINNNIPLPYGTLHEKLPQDFFSSTYTIDDYIKSRAIKPKIGTRTSMAEKVPANYEHTHAFQIKQSAHGELGMGLVTHFDEIGLAETFELVYAPEHQGKFIDKRNKIIGVYKKYDMTLDNKTVCIESKIIDREEILQEMQLAA